MLTTSAARLISGPQAGNRTVVVGAGALGLYTAVELAKRGRPVVLIESGGVQLGGFPASSISSVGRKHKGLFDGRSRTLGGTTNLWGGQLVQFQPIDFAGRDWLPGSRWPVSYDEIAPFYRDTYLNLGVPADTIDDDEVWRSVSTPRPDLGDDLEIFLTRWLRTPGFAHLFADSIEKDERLTVLAEHTANGFRAQNGRITAVRVLDRQRQPLWIEGSTFVLAAGTIENARLLLHGAADDSWPCPWRANTNIGARFQDHLGGKVATIHPTDKRAFFRAFCTIARSGNKFQPKVRVRSQSLERESVLNVQAFFAFESSASEHLVYLKQFLKASVQSRRISGLRDVLRHGPASVRYLIPLMWRYAWDHRVFVPSTSKSMLWVQAEQEPLDSSRVRIDTNARDEHGLPRVVLDWRVGERELPSIRSFVQRLDRAFQSSNLARLDIDRALLDLDPAFLDTLGDTYHPAGGTIMGFSERDGVVDRDLRVFGADNLYVAGPSVFRTCSNANVTFTALAFATRLVYHLAK